eukprot:10695798-Karenia_brevis.AAC.1
MYVKHDNKIYSVIVATSEFAMIALGLVVGADGNMITCVRSYTCLFVLKDGMNPTWHREKKKKKHHVWME